MNFCLIDIFYSSGVPLETMVKFNRLKQLTTDFNIIAVALKKSQSGLVEVNLSIVHFNSKPKFMYYVKMKLLNKFLSLSLTHMYFKV